MRGVRIALGIALALVACRDNPNIDGTKVAKLSPGVGCDQICGRIAELWDIAVQEPEDSPNQHGLF